jgi:hypothetical protein
LERRRLPILSSCPSGRTRSSYSNATKDPGTFKLRWFYIKPLILQWILGIHRQREKPGLFCWITVGLHGRHQLTDLGQEERTASRQHEAPRLSRSAPVKAANRRPDDTD